ncbi:glycosyltransferase family 2 protein [Citrobacter sedlakii]|uniref:glycosyltransferase family 2 protein n=1 Tax=Citrobacter sedlakii TaxID=67826 RepID=UPI002B229E24|nr:glycosyltransferase family 2 protein [Citrobacter sedlakii]MEB0951763.1 glycosyltransferase family 2 protein [Citrobacter sedlakii]
MVYICVLMWNNVKDTIACIDSLSLLEYKKTSIVIIDNKSEERFINEFHKILAEKKYSYNSYTIADSVISKKDSVYGNGEKSISILYNDKNAGFAAGNNIGIKFSLTQVDCEYIWILNNDTIVDMYSLSNMISSCQEKDTTHICGSKLIYYPDTSLEQGIGGRFSKISLSTRHIKSSDIIDAHEKNIDYIIGASMLVPREIFDAIGLLDENFFLYFEELDFCLRARKKGYTLNYCLESIVYHKESATIGDQKSYFSTYHYFRSQRMFLKKHYPKLIILMNIKLIMLIINSLRKGNLAQAKKMFRIWYDISKVR